VYFSCKITNAILNHLESEKIDLSGIFSEIESELDIPWENVRDSSNWMRAPDMEALLERIISDHQLLVAAGHSTPKKKVWGVLDSVLRMMPRPQEIFQQPEKFLGYFISPEPPVENIVRTETGISFDIPLPAEQYPLVTTYLKSAFEALPMYVGLDAGNSQWTMMHFSLDWPATQQTILSGEHHQVSPQLMQEVIRQLQNSSRELEEKNRELQRRNEELLRFPMGESVKPELTSQNFSEFDFMKRPVHQVAQNLSRLHDYMVRAHQLVTLLTAGQKQTPGIKEAFRRVDWEIVKNQYPQIILESLATLKTLNRKETEADKVHESSKQLEL
jgi:hypothetical protein